MRKSLVCIKCSSKNVKKIGALPLQIQNGVFPKFMKPCHYICTDCGYLETWVESDKELSYINGRY